MSNFELWQSVCRKITELFPHSCNAIIACMVTESLQDIGTSTNDKAKRAHRRFLSSVLHALNN